MVWNVDRYASLIWYMWCRIVDISTEYNYKEINKEISVKYIRVGISQRLLGNNPKIEEKS